MRAGARTTARVVLENAGGATWRSRGADGLQLSYHWLDRHGNAIVWDGVRTAFPHPVPPGATLELDVPVDGVRPPGRYVLAFDFVEEHRFWLSEVGIPTRDVEIDVLPLIDERRLGVVVHGGPDEGTAAALAAQEEPLVDDAPTATAHLVAGARPAPDWSRLVLDAHAEGWQAVGPAVRTGGRRARATARRPRSPAVGARGPQPPLRPAARAAVARRRARADDAPRAPRLRGGGRALRGTCRRHASEAIRSSTALKTTAPSTSATTAATQT